MIVHETRLVLVPGADDEFLKALRPYVGTTRGEPGCVRAELHQNRNEPGSYVLSEVFRDHAAHEEHIGRPHSQGLVERLRPFLAAPPVHESFDSVLRIPLPPPLPRGARSTRETATHHAPISFLADRRTPHVVVRLDSLELATGTDGIFHGHPDPCLVVGVYALGDNEPCILGRGLLRIGVKKSPPCVVAGTGALLEAPLGASDFPMQLAVLAIAVEENDGRGVQRAYQGLEWVDSLMFWKVQTSEPTLVPLRELAGFGPAQSTRPCPVEVFARGDALSDALHGDTWVGASVSIVSLEKPDSATISRFHFASDPDENDWVAVLRTEFSL